jgi:hypothetical protein
MSMTSERLAFYPRQKQDIEIFSDRPFEWNNSSVAPFVAHLQNHKPTAIMGDLSVT